MNVSVMNAQREERVETARMARLARAAVKRLGITGRGTLAVTFVDARRMRTLNKRFLGHDRATDVLSFRYDGEPVVGEILVAPGQARAYAKQHGLPYQQELSRYVVHGILHWLGHEDKTTVQRQDMRRQEDRVLTACGIPVQLPRAPSPEPRAAKNGHPHR